MPSSSNWLQLARRTAIVTGSASGIGKAVAETLQDAGCRLICVDTHQQPSNNSDHIDCDVSDACQVASLFEQHGLSVSILVNCAGIIRDGKCIHISQDDWNRVLDVNLKGTFNMCQGFIRNHLKHHPETKEDIVYPAASIVNIGSVVSEQGNVGQANYAASKGGVVGLTRALAKETALRGIRVNAVIPGFIETPMSQAVPPKILASIQSRIAMKKFGEPQDIANLVAFLASERSRYITGETIECSGMISL